MKANVTIVIPYNGFYSDFSPLLTERLTRVSADEHAAVETVVTPYPFKTSKLITKAQTALIIVSNLFYLFVRFAFGRSRRSETIVLGGHLVAIPALFLARALPLLTGARRIIVTCFFVHELAKKRSIRRVLSFLLNDPRVTLVTQSPYEVQFYSKIADRADVVLFPYCRREVRATGSSGEGQEYVFSGGYTNRDYDCLLRAARMMQSDFIIACSRLNKIENPPANVTVLYDIAPGEFHSYVKNATIVVIPLKEETGASGQMVALAAMFFAKPIIHTALDCVSQYFENGISGLSYARGDAEELADKISQLLSDPPLREKLGRNIRKRYEESFTVLRYCDFLATLIVP